MNNIMTDNQTMQNKIFTVRDVQVMLDVEDESLRSKISTSNLKTFDENKILQLHGGLIEMKHIREREFELTEVLAKEFESNLSTIEVIENELKYSLGEKALRVIL